jgi:hypothetical protein
MKRSEEEENKKFFMSKEKFSQVIHELASYHSMTLFDAVLMYSEENGLEIEECIKFIDNNLLAKIRVDYNVSGVIENGLEVE